MINKDVHLDGIIGLQVIRFFIFQLWYTSLIIMIYTSIIFNVDLFSLLHQQSMSYVNSLQKFKMNKLMFWKTLRIIKNTLERPFFRSFLISLIVLKIHKKRSHLLSGEMQSLFYKFEKNLTFFLKQFNYTYTEEKAVIEHNL